MDKLCGKCGETKDISRFTKSTGVKSGYRSPCKDCNNAYYAQRRVEQYDKVRGYEKKFHTERRLRCQYGTTVEEVEIVKHAQDYRCAVCNEEAKLVIDHCHTKGTGHFRGLLCSPCNLGLGHFRDDPNIIRKAAEYLERYISTT
jgi:hypothetical protein